MNKLRFRFELAFGLAFYVALAALMFDIVGNRKVRPPGYPPETWLLLHNYPISLIWNTSLIVGAALLFLVLPAALIYFIWRGAKRDAITPSSRSSPMTVDSRHSSKAQKASL